MTFQDFRQAFFHEICFTTNQVFAWQQTFDKNNLVRWTQKGYLFKLRNGYYTFREYRNTENINLFIGNRIYKPSYISLHTALAFYGLIPEAIAQTTSVSTLKTTAFINQLGEFSYKTVKPAFFFAYQQLSYQKDRNILMATPEKALLDLLYLYPFYNTLDEMHSLRLDENVLGELLNIDHYRNCIKLLNNKALKHRANLLLKAYQIN